MSIELSKGDRFGRLQFMSISEGQGKGKPRLGLWRCDCGNGTVVPITRVVNGYTVSCGCFRPGNPTHGMRSSAEYTSWQAMLRRCHNETDKDYPRYGARGIQVCDAWRGSFAAFFAEIGPRPAGTTVDRIDGTKGYEPGNVRWATPKEQARNRRDLTMVKTPNGLMALVDYAASIGITKGAAHLRLKRGTLEGASRV